MTLLAAVAVVSVMFGVVADSAAADTPGPPSIISVSGSGGSVTMFKQVCLVSGRDFVEQGSGGSFFIVTDYTLNLKAVSPSVYGYPNLAMTWVISQAQLVDLTTGAVTSAAWPAWATATPTQPASFPAITFSMPVVGDTYKVQYNIWWQKNGVLTGHEVVRSNRYTSYFAYHNQTTVTEQASCFV
jgi:hypothetical protein